MMLLVVDIGNSQVTLGVYQGENLSFRWGLTSAKLFSEDEYGILLFNLLQKANIADKIEGAVVSSVVTHLTYEIKGAIEKYLNISPVMISHKSNMGGVKLSVDSPEEVGADRICNVVAAHLMYEKPSVIVDMGTATTFDVLTSDGEFIGGAICPGIALCIKALANNTSLLPEVQVTHTSKAIATNTITNILSGTVIGHAAMVEGMLYKIEKELNQKIISVGTGGYSIYVEEHLIKPFDHFNPQLTMDGLRLLYELNK